MNTQSGEILTKDFFLGEFTKLHTRLDDLHDYMDMHFDAIYERLDGLDVRMGNLENRMDFLVHRFDNHLEDCVHQEQHFKLKRRVKKLEKVATI